MSKVYQKVCALLLLIVFSILVVFLLKKSPVTYIPIQSPPPQTEVQNSVDGTHVLTLKKTLVNNQTTYTYISSPKAKPSEKVLLTKTVDQNKTYSIPPNSWSPDNAFVFIREQTATSSAYYVIPVKENVETELMNTNIVELFMKKYPALTVTDVTGWASPTLLILNTKTNQEKGPSFWFDIPSKSFIQLSS